MKVFFIGAGPGDPELITCRGKKLIQAAAVIIYAGSLVNPAVLTWKQEGAQVYDSAAMTLEEVCRVYAENQSRDGLIVRLHTGDPALYSAIGEQIRFLAETGLEWEVVPGVSSFSAAAAALGLELTLPGLSQSVVITRRAGRTGVPEKEALANFARTGASLALFLSAGMIEEVMREIEPWYGGETPVAVVYRASWEDQKVVTGTVATIAGLVKQEGIERQAIILVGRVIGAREFEASRLYAADFSHGYRRTAGKNGEG